MPEIKTDKTQSELNGMVSAAHAYAIIKKVFADEPEPGFYTSRQWGEHWKLSERRTSELIRRMLDTDPPNMVAKKFSIVRLTKLYPCVHYKWIGPKEKKS